MMTATRDWQLNRNQWMTLLEKQTGRGVAEWNRRIGIEGMTSEGELRSWLTKQGVTGYPRQLLIMERFGYPDFVLSTAGELIDRQYAGYPQLRPIYGAIVEAASRCGEVILQARKSYVSLLTPRRTFARVKRSTASRVDLGLRLEQRPGGRLQRSTLHETMPVQIGLTSPKDVDSEIRKWLRRAYVANC
jgi:hypothetical protein